MRISVARRMTAVITVILLTAQYPLPAQPAASAITPRAVLHVMQRVADWQLAHPSKHRPTDWTQGAGDAGFMALAGISGNPKYREAMLTMGASNHWRLGPREYMADDQCVGQAYAELYSLYRDPKMLAPMRGKFDAILAHPSAVTSLEFKQPHGRATQLWSWCDSLFMAPPTWVRLYTATGDSRYLHFAVTNWWRTTDFLYDTNEHLYFRDSTYFAKRESNGRKIFWSRGNGWVVAGLVRVLQYLPMNDPSRPRFERLFQEMAGKILAIQQPDGLWHASLLDPQDYPEKETSGSGFFTYALAWGVNQGLLDRAKFEPAVRKAWTALVDCVDRSGKLTHVQPVGADPKKFDPNATEVYGVGAFLLAGSEVYRMAVLESENTAVVAVTNPADFRRVQETVEINLPDLYRFLPPFQNMDNLQVMDGVSSRLLPSQCYATQRHSIPNKLLFQVDLAPGETRKFHVLAPSPSFAVPPPIIKTFARFVPERYDDFAWESDRIAHRMYGPALMTAPGGDHLVSSGVDVWVKRTRRLIVNQLYAAGHYHEDNGVAMDDYRVGTSRGDGGLGIWNGKKLFVSRNFHHWRIFTTGPIRSEFELTYDAWNADGRRVSETKRISIDAGSNLSRVRSLFTADPADAGPLTLGVGLAERPGENVVVPDGTAAVDSWENSNAKGLVVQNRAEGWMTYWQPQDFNKGTIGVAVVLPKGSIEAFTNDNPHLPASAFAPPKRTVVEGQPVIRDLLAVTRAEPGKPFVYYLGAGWSESGDFPNAAAWNNYIRHFVECRDHPLQVAIRSR